MKKTLKLKIITSMLVFLFFVPSVLATNIFLESSNSEFFLGNKFEVNFFIDTQVMDINALEGKVIFPEKLLELKEINDGNSIVNFWVERPKVVDNTVFFSGIIPGGYESNRGFIFSLVFQSRQEGQDLIKIDDLRVLLNDGKGTQVATTVSDFNIIISKQASTSKPLIEEVADVDPPEIFEPIITKDSLLFSGDNFVVFVTQDKGSGIDHYEIKENREFNIGKWKFGKNKNWTVVENPYLLEDQELKSFIYVKAIDKNKNERIAILLPQHFIKWYEIWWIWCIIVASIFILYFATKILWKKKTHE